MKFINVFKRALRLLNYGERKKLFFLSVLVALMSVFEIFGVVSILPFMSVATNPSSIHDNEYLFYVYSKFGFSSDERFLIALAVFALIALLVGNVFRAVSSFLLLRFAQMQNHYLAERVFKHYLKQPYEYFLEQNSSDLTKLVLGEVGQLVGGLYVPAIRAFGRFCTVIAIVFLLLFVNVKVALTMLLVMSIYYLTVYKSFKNSLMRLGTERVEVNKARFRLVSESSGGIKAIKLAGKERIYAKLFKEPSVRLARIVSTSASYGELPRFLLEVIAFGGMLIIVIFFIMQEGHSKAISLASLYAFSGYKLMPALQEIFLAITKVKFALPVLFQVENSLKGYDEGEELQLPSNKIQVREVIELRDVSFSYKDSLGYVLRDINIEIKAKTTVGIVGVTGSGKSTLVDIILGLLTPREGDLVVDGEKIDFTNTRNWQCNIGYVPQSIYLSDDTILKNIAFGVPEDSIDIKRVEDVARLAQIDDFIKNQLDKGYQTRVGERGVRLSGGQIQRIGIARALYDDPELLVFDEATSALDFETERSVIQALENLAGKKTIIMIAHRLETLHKADKIIKIKNGKAYEQSVEYLNLMS